MDYGFVKQLIWLLSRRYPERLGKCLIVNSPFIFTGCWALIRLWLVSLKFRTNYNTWGGDCPRRSKIEKKTWTGVCFEYNYSLLIFASIFTSLGYMRWHQTRLFLSRMKNNLQNSYLFMLYQNHFFEIVCWGNSLPEYLQDLIASQQIVFVFVINVLRS